LVTLVREGVERMNAREDLVASSREEIAVAVSVAGCGGLDGLSRVTRTISLLEVARVALIESLRESGASWGEIGRACGMTRQGAQRRWAKRVRGMSFGAAAPAYERARPSYPPAAVDWIVPAGVHRVLDVGAGTGKLTRQLLDRGLDAVAVEPLREMRAEFARMLPGAEIVEGYAEEMPFPDDSFDMVVFGHTWHWVDSTLALPEVIRVLRGGGWLAAIWNIRDLREPWFAELERIMQQGPHRVPDTAPVFGEPFGAVERFELEWTERLTPEQLLDLVASWTYVITLAEEQRAEVIARARVLIETHPALAGRREIMAPYVTKATRTQVT